MSDDVSPEMESIEAFGEYLLAEDRTTFTYDEACKVAEALGFSIATPIIQGLKAYGFQMDERLPPRRVRGFHSNSHDRWSGPGSMRTFGGSGWEQISGFAGQKG